MSDLPPPRPPPIRSSAPRADRLATRRSQRRRRSALVRMWRLLTPLLFLAIVAAVVGWIVGRSRARHAPPTPPAATIHMTKPQFYGRTSRGEPYVLTGDDAVRDGKDPHQIALTNPFLTVTNEKGPPSTVTSLTGLFHDDTNKLAMFGNVVLHDGKGDVFHSDRGEIDTVSGDIVGHDHATADGPAGHNEGDAYALSDKGDHATFTGRVRSHWNSRTPAAASAPTAPSGATTKP